MAYTSVDKVETVIETGEIAHEYYTPYNKMFIESLKARIPREDRHWDNDNKCWTVTASYEDDMSYMIKLYFGEVV